MHVNAPNRRRAGLPENRIFYILLAAFLLAAAITAYLVYDVVRDAVVAMTQDPSGPAIQGVSLAAEAEQNIPLDLNAPLQPASGPEPGEWDGKKRITLLLLGLDYRSWIAGNGPPLADTIIVATIDPESQTAALLSVPRDLWVNIPGMGYHKINQAYQLGEANAVQGGGAGLTIETVERLLEIEIQFYAQIDFGAFVSLIDEIEGVKINVPETITIDPLGDHNTTTLQPGVQTLPGDLALAYARARNTSGSDFDRAQRQQQVILGVRERVISFQMLPTLFAKAPVLYAELAQGVRTNLSLQQLVNLSWMAHQIQPDHIRQAVIGPDQVTFSTSGEGMSILLPIPDAMLDLSDETFSVTPVETIVANPETTATPAVSLTTLERVQAEQAQVALYNATFVTGLASRTNERLFAEGLEVVLIDNADQIYELTTLIDYTGNPNTIEFIANLLGIPPSRIYHRYDPDSLIDVALYLGEDFAKLTPTPAPTNTP